MPLILLEPFNKLSTIKILKKMSGKQEETQLIQDKQPLFIQDKQPLLELALLIFRLYKKSKKLEEWNQLHKEQLPVV